ncbi:MAG: hypothetical protein HOQ20_00800 [Bradyrhizobium sp.]|nr:hypothetical protein [Bradyrhizobium sp.]
MAKDAREDAVVNSERMERSIEAANKTAGAAVDQVRLAEDATYRQLRAYLSVEVGTIYSDGQLVKGSLTIKNAGQTPAKIEIFLESAVAKFPITERLPEMPEPVRFYGHNPYVNARSVETRDWFYAKHRVPDAAANIARWVAESDKTAFWLYGRIEFADYLSRQTRILHFAFRNHGTAKVGVPVEMVPATWGNSYEKREL